MTEAAATFDAVAELYDRVRPTYPDALFDELFSRLPPAPEIVEVGPGTGQATGSLLAHGAVVTAVERGPALAALLCAKHPSVHLVAGRFEEVDLPTAAFDALVSATAYHWITGSARLEKPAAIVRPGGWLATIDPIQVDAPSDRGFFDRVQPISIAHGHGATHGPTPKPAEARAFIADELAGSPLYGPPEQVPVRWDQTYTTADYGDLMRSYSVTQLMSPADAEALIGDIAAVIDAEFGGLVTRPLVTVMTLAQVLPD